MEIDVQSYKRVDMLKVSGRVDSATAPDLETAFTKLTDEGRYQLVIELADVNYMSSAGLRAMVAALRECRKHNGDLRIANPSQRIEEVLTLAGLDSVFSIYEDAVGAVGSY